MWELTLASSPHLPPLQPLLLCVQAAVCFFFLPPPFSLFVFASTFCFFSFFFPPQFKNRLLWSKRQVAHSAFCSSFLPRLLFVTSPRVRQELPLLLVIIARRSSRRKLSRKRKKKKEEAKSGKIKSAISARRIQMFSTRKLR